MFYLVVKIFQCLVQIVYIWPPASRGGLDASASLGALPMHPGIRLDTAPLPDPNGQNLHQMGIRLGLCVGVGMIT